MGMFRSHNYDQANNYALTVQLLPLISRILVFIICHIIVKRWDFNCKLFLGYE